MFCKNCGRELKEGEVCSCTANNVNYSESNNSDSQQASQQNSQQGAYQQPPYQQVPQPMYQQMPQWAPASPATAVLKRTASSGMTLALCVLMTVGLVVQLLMGLFSGSVVTSTMDQLGMVTYTTGVDMSSVATVSTIIGTLIGMIPQILIVIGAWMFYKSWKDPMNLGGNAKGLGLIKGGIITNIVVGCIAVVFVAFAAIAGSAVMQVILEMLMYGTDSYMTGDVSTAYSAMQVLLVVIVVIAILSVALSVLLYIFQLKTVNSIKNTAMTGAPATKISMFVVVMLYISGVFAIIGSVSNFGLGIITGAAAIIAGLLLQRLRKEMLNIAMVDARAAYSTQAYAAPQVVCPSCGMNYDPSGDRCPRCGTPNQNR